MVADHLFTFSTNLTNWLFHFVILQKKNANYPAGFLCFGMLFFGMHLVLGYDNCFYALPSEQNPQDSGHFSSIKSL